MKKFVIGFIILLAVVAIGVGGYFLWNHLNNSNDSHSNKTTNSSTENSQTKENKNKEKITKIIGVKEFESDILGKYTSKIEASFQDGKLTTIKTGFYDLKDEYILQTLKANYEKSDIANKIVIGDNSFSYELTAEEYAESLKNPNAIELVTRNYIYSNLKKNGYTVTVEGDDSFLGDNNQTSENAEQSTNEASNSNTENSNTSSLDVDVDSMVKNAEEYMNTEEFKKAQQQATEYLKNNKEQIEEAAKNAEQKANEYIQNNQEQIEAAKKEADELRKQYGF